MRSRLLSIAALVVLIGTVIGVVVLVPNAPPAPSHSPGPGTPVPSGDGPPPPPAGTTYRDYVYQTTVVTALPPVRTQSKLWFAQGGWWAGLLQPATDRIDIFRLDAATQEWIDTGILVDERSNANPDFLWTGEHLYVVSSGARPTARNAARVMRFSYDDTTDRFTPDPNFPVRIVDTGVSSPVIEMDSAGTLWVTYAANDRIWVTHSLDHDAHWIAPYPLPVPSAAVGADDIASIVAFGPGQIGVMWSNQPRDSVYFSTHADGTADDAWSSPETVLDGVGSSADRIDLKTYPMPGGDRTGVVVALKTSLDGAEPRNNLDPQILLAVRDAGGAWSTSLVGRVRDHHTRALVLVDHAARTFYVVMTAPAGGGALYYKRTSIDQIVFDTGLGVPLMISEADIDIDHGSSRKGPLSAEAGLFVLGSDEGSGRYLHALVDLGGGQPTADPGDPARLERPALPPSAPTVYLDADFEPWAVGPADGTGWLSRPEDPAGAVVLVDDGGGGRALRVRTPGGRAGTRACHDVPEVPGALLSVDGRIRTSALGNDDTTLLSVRGPGGEAASVRVTDRGVLAWFAGATKIRSTTLVRPGTWYRIAVTIDQTARTYAVRFQSDTGQTIIERADLPWRTPSVETAGSVCFETAGASRAQTIDIADIRVLEEARP